MTPAQQEWHAWLRLYGPATRSGTVTPGAPIKPPNKPGGRS